MSKKDNPQNKNDGKNGKEGKRSKDGKNGKNNGKDGEIKPLKPVIDVKLTGDEVRHRFEKLSRSYYEAELAALQFELVRFQYWVKETGQRITLIFEGRDAAGKGGTIKSLMDPLNPRGVRLVALGKPSDVERTQWYFQRYVSHLPASGEIVVFDRSWYNRAGVEHVMGFCTDAEYWDFLRSCPEFERLLVHAGIKVVKYWLSVSDEEQEKRFQQRAGDPAKLWKLSPMDLLSRERWVDYSKAKDRMLEYTDIEESPWFQIDSDDKRRAHLNCIHHLLSLFPEYQSVIPKPIKLEPRPEADQKYARPPREAHPIVPDHYVGYRREESEKKANKGK